MEAEVKQNLNPIGSIHKLDQIEEKISDLCSLWDATNKKPDNWLTKYGLKSKLNLILVTNFLLGALDELVSTIDLLLESGPDKKATVLNGLDRLYEYIIKEGLPLWARPFAAPLKNYIIYTLASGTIDWMIEKYRNGSWRDKLKKI